MQLIAISGACKGRVSSTSGSLPPSVIKFMMPKEPMPIRLDDYSPNKPTSFDTYVLEYKLVAFDSKKAFYIPLADDLVDSIDELLNPAPLEQHELMKRALEIREIDPFSRDVVGQILEKMNKW